MAKRKLKELVEGVSNRTPQALEQLAARSQTVKEYAKEWLQKREAQGIVMAPDERRNLERHVLPSVGHLPLGDVRSSHVGALLQAMLLKRREPGRPRRGPAASAAAAGSSIVTIVTARAHVGGRFGPP